LPLYDYRCRDCSKVTEVRHAFREAHQAVCPACGGELARVFTPAGIVFKGSGFYLTDSRKASEKAKSGDAGTSSEPAKTAEPAKTSESPAAATPAAATATPAPSSGAPAPSTAKSESSAA
jgi:putative FmdB family regulatory protein